MDRMENRVYLDRMDLTDPLPPRRLNKIGASTVLRDRLEAPEMLDPRDHPETTECLDSLDSPEILEAREPPDHRDSLDKPDSQETEDSLVSQDVSTRCPAPTDHQDNRDNRDNPDLRDHPDSPDSLDKMASKDPKEIWATTATTETQAPTETQDKTEMSAQAAVAITAPRPGPLPDTRWLDVETGLLPHFIGGNLCLHIFVFFFPFSRLFRSDTQ